MIRYYRFNVWARPFWLPTSGLYDPSAETPMLGTPIGGEGTSAANLRFICEKTCYWPWKELDVLLISHGELKILLDGNDVRAATRIENIKAF